MARKKQVEEEIDIQEEADEIEATPVVEESLLPPDAVVINKRVYRKWTDANGVSYTEPYPGLY